MCGGKLIERAAYRPVLLGVHTETQSAFNRVVVR